MAQIILVSHQVIQPLPHNATLLFQEYKDSNLWYASSGFVFATATAILRIANNKHYSSDVLAGAGFTVGNFSD
jgi:membrane-associated phospholipid phosphatase